MRILAVSDFYPPHHIGGYELACRDTLEALSRRGHDIHVLTSTHAVGASVTEGNVRRWLRAYTAWPPPGKLHAFGCLVRKEITNQRAFRLAVEEVRPDVVYLWNLSHVSVSIAFIAERGATNVCYRGMYWHEWDNDAWWGLWNHHSANSLVQAAKWLPRKLFEAAHMIHDGDLMLEHIHFPTRMQKQATLDAGKPVEHAIVTGQSFCVGEFPLGGIRFPPARLLFVGRVIPDKGIETAIRALALISEHSNRPVSLTVVGAPMQPAFGEKMQELAADLGLSKIIEWRGAVPHQQMPGLYREHDIFVMPSYSESFSLTTAEAMSSGAAVVSSGVGGMSELVEHQRTGLIFEPGDAQECARLVIRLMEDEALYTQLRGSAREKVERDFSFENTIDRIEAHLYEAAGINPEEDNAR